jgi:hypothetical protein
MARSGSGSLSGRVNGNCGRTTDSSPTPLTNQRVSLPSARAWGFSWGTGHETQPYLEALLDDFETARQNTEKERRESEATH